VPEEAKAPTGNCATHTHTLTLPQQREKGKQTGACAQGRQLLGAAVTPAITKAIHIEGPIQRAQHVIQSCQPYTVLTVLRPATTPPKRDERKNKRAQALVHGDRGDRLQGWTWADRTTHPGCGGDGALRRPGSQPHLMPQA
jgi:hypothetical protein